MIKFLSRIAAPVYWLLVFTDLVAVLFDFKWLIYIAKPLLMPALMMITYRVIQSQGRKLILAGLFFSWLGDVFLLFDQLSSIFFIAGLVSFLITHAFYIIYFLSIKSPSDSLLKKRPFYFLLMVCYGTGLVWLLFPYLGPLKIPVIVYASVICFMLLCSIHIYPKLYKPANRYFVTGATLFVLSDSILAINKFYQPLPFGAISIMLTYCVAQYFIVTGFTSSNDSYKK